MAGREYDFGTPAAAGFVLDVDAAFCGGLEMLPCEAERGSMKRLWPLPFVVVVLGLGVAVEGTGVGEVVLLLGLAGAALSGASSVKSICCAGCASGCA